MTGRLPEKRYRHGILEALRKLRQRHEADGDWLERPGGKQPARRARRSATCASSSTKNSVMLARLATSANRDARRRDCREVREPPSARPPPVRQRRDHGVEHVVQPLAKVLGKKPQHEITVLLEQRVFSAIAASIARWFVVDGSSD